MVITSNWINEQIRGSQERRDMAVLGEQYYRMENPFILGQKKEVTVTTNSGQSVTLNSWMSNQRIASGFLKILVMQKVFYSVNNSLTGMFEDVDIREILGKNIIDDLQEAGLEAGKKGFAIWQMYIGKNGKIRRRLLPSEQFTLCYDDDILQYVIRNYSTYGADGKTVQRCEVWDSETKYVYDSRDGTTWLYNGDLTANHYSMCTTVGALKTESGRGWGVPPFCVLWNDEYRDNDLKPIKNDIDSFDLTKSELVNIIEDNGSPLMVLKNFNGSSIAEVQQVLNTYRACHTDEDSDVEFRQLEISFEARKACLEQLTEDIFKFGMGVDTMKLSGNVTNDLIESMYNNLNLKANKFEENIRDFLRQAMQFYITPIGTQIDPDETGEIDLDLQFTRDMITNKQSLAELSNASYRMVSEQTRLAMNPFVTDVEEEMKLMEAEHMKMLDEVEEPVNVAETV